MNSSFYTSLTGLKTFQSGIDVWAHNLSNSNLAGYRAKRAEFTTLFTDSLSSNGSSNVVSSQKSYGSALGVTTMTKDQGSLTTTESAFDLAIDGNGWFGVLDRDGNRMYTRNGNFDFDRDRYLVDTTGGYVTGQMAGNILISPDATNNKLIGVVQDITVGDPVNQGRIQLPNMLSYPKKYTDTVSVSGNLGFEDIERTFSANLVSATESTNTLSVSMKKSAIQPDVGSTWEFTATIKNSDGTTTFDKQSGTLTFNGEGQIIDSTTPTLLNDGLPVKLDFGDKASGLQSNDSGSISLSVEKNGEPAGELSYYSVSQDGNIVAFFDNGYKTVVAKVAVYHFRNEQGLQEIGGSYYDANEMSGEPLFYKDDAGKIITTEGLVLGYHLEESNMDSTEALSELMVIQRAFDAASRALSAGDDMIKQALQMDA
jgi:flagellar hook protein FlgE